MIQAIAVPAAPTLRAAPSSSLAELRDDLADRAREYHDFKTNTTDLFIDEETAGLVVRSQDFKEYRLKPHALNQLAAKLGIPGAYLQKCPNGLAAENLNYWLDKVQGMPLLMRCDGDSVRAVLSHRYAPVDNTDLVGWLAEGISHETRLRYEVTDEVLAIQFVEDRAHQAGSGDDLLPGLAVRNSEVGLASVELSGLVYRTICLNGLILTRRDAVMKRRHVAGAGRLQPQRTLYQQVTGAGPLSLREQVRRAVHDLRGASRAALSRFSGTQGIRIPDMPKLFERLAERFKLTKPQQEAVTAAFTVEPGDSLYHAINAVTRAGNADTLDLDSRRELQQHGGRMLELAESGRRWIE